MTKFPISLRVPSQEMLKETRGKPFRVFSVHNPLSENNDEEIWDKERIRDKETYSPREKGE